MNNQGKSDLAAMSDNSVNYAHSLLKTLLDLSSDILTSFSKKT